MKFKFILLTITILTNPIILQHSFLKVELKFIASSLSQTLNLELTRYSAKDISEKDIKKKFLTCTFDRTNFCEPGIESVIFEFYVKNKSGVYPILQDERSFSIINVTCSGTLDGTYDVKNDKFSNFYKNMKDFTLIKDFRYPEIFGCAALPAYETEITDEATVVHKVIFDVNNPGLWNDQFINTEDAGMKVELDAKENQIVNDSKLKYIGADYAIVENEETEEISDAMEKDGETNNDVETNTMETDKANDSESNKDKDVESIKQENAIENKLVFEQPKGSKSIFKDVNAAGGVKATEGKEGVSGFVGKFVFGVFMLFGFL